MVKAHIIEVLHDDTTTGRGEYEFVQLPAANDQFTLPSSIPGVLDTMQVLYVEYRPTRIDQPDTIPFSLPPSATIHAKLIGEWDGE